MKATLEQLKAEKLREREKFMNMMLAIKQEDELKDRLKRENQLTTKSQLDKQVLYKRQMAEEQVERIHKSFGDALPPYLEDKERTFSVEENALPRKRLTLTLYNKSAIREDLKKQMADKDFRKKQEREADLCYG